MSDSDPPPRRRFQFSLRTLFLAMLLCSVLSTVLAGMLNPESVKRIFPRGTYVLVAAAAPMAVMIVLSVWQAITRWINRRR